jgi:NodT family efflux transporter outer membrane factor (OMF) lipoprotein
MDCRTQFLSRNYPPRMAIHSRQVAQALALLLVATLAGCSTGLSEYVHNGFKVGPNYRRPAAPVSENWIDYLDSRVHSEPPQHWAWWSTFNDPVLNSLIENAHQQNLTLREAGFRVAESRALRGFAVGNLFPQRQQAFGSYNRFQFSRQGFGTIGTGIGGGGIGGGGIGGGGIGGGGAGGSSFPRNISLWQLGTQLAWELDFWGRFRRAIEAADAELDASVENYDDVLVILLSDVASTYVEIRTLEQRVRFARRNVQYQTGSLELAKIRLQEGAASRLDVTQAQTNVAQTAAAIPVLETQLRQAQNRLCVLLGVPPQDLSQRLGAGPIPSAPPEVAVGIPAELIRRRPDIRRAEREVAAQSARIGIAEADLYPAFTINGSIFLQASQFKDLFRSSAIGGNVGPAFNWNILNYGRIQNLVAAEEARFFREATEYQNAVLNANREAEDAIVAFLQAQVQTARLREGVVAAAESRDLVMELYRGGRADFGRVFVAEFFLAQQQDLLAQAEGEIAQALVAVYRALGGGWEIRLNAPPPTTPVGAAVVPSAGPAQPEPVVPNPVPPPQGNDVGNGDPPPVPALN